MQDSQLKDYKFKSIYQFVNIIYGEVMCGFDFWNFNTDLFVQSALKFNRDTLLHLYVSSTLYCYYLKDFRKNTSEIEEDSITWWIDLMKEYGLKINKRDYKKDDDEGALKWFEKNEDVFCEFFDVISDEVVHILFNDKQFLVHFNRIVRNVLIDEDDTYAEYCGLKWPDGARNINGTIKRCTIPKWVKKAVFHRDKGHCVFCNKDLTHLDTILDSQENYDHIIPLKDYGTNDPCNIQLTCERCNKSKGGKVRVPKYKYQSWW